MGHFGDEENTSTKTNHIQQEALCQKSIQPLAFSRCMTILCCFNIIKKTW